MRRCVVSGVIFLGLAGLVLLCTGKDWWPPQTDHRIDAVHQRIAGRRVDPATSCGPASLAVVSTLLGSPIPIADLHADTHAGEIGVCSFQDMKISLLKHGFCAEAIRYDPRHPPSHELPLILHVDDSHFLVALPVRGDRCILIDPPDEPRVVGWASLGGRWKGDAIIVSRNDSDLRRAIN